MSRIQFGDGACEKTLKYLDSYVSNELLVETNHEVLRHLDNCRSCSAEVDARLRLRLRLKSAIKNQVVPSELHVRIREEIRRKQSRSWFTAASSRWAVASAAIVMVSVAVWRMDHQELMPSIGDRPAQQQYIQKISAKVASVLKPGLGDHVHCAKFRHYPQSPPSVAKMELELGPAYEGLLPLARGAAPEGYRVVMAHQCSYAGRDYIHLTLRRGELVLSLVIARKKEGEAMSSLQPAASASGIPVYQSAIDRYQIAGFEAGSYLVYVVSELKTNANVQVAVNLAPGVRDVLAKAGA